uniref:Calmodulin n=1 Tax=Trieres chinensis TaxID=1514140 RepID=A0A7S2EJ89_TRICV|mmetsp:Transcript_25242/g.51509  ORF Transcript_25242/g.51509 Transcript_25242/m.51509 type:complete len:462 (+) Transcript_25242:3-1388(+)
MLQHPWVSGEAAATSKIAGSAAKLERFKDLQTKVEAGIFAVLVNHGNPNSERSEVPAAKLASRKSAGIDNTPASSAAPTHLMKRAFEVFDAEGKGYVSPDDLGRVVSQTTGSEVSSHDGKDMLAAVNDAEEDDMLSEGLSLSDFSKVFVRLKHKHFPRGHVIFRAGEEGDAMYFINSGKVEIQTRKGQLVAILRHGDFFGEGSLMDEQNRRFTTAKCSTPVDVIKIKREDFDRYVASSTAAKQQLRRKWNARNLTYAKNLIRLQTNVRERTFKKDEVVYAEGDEGNSMFFVDEKEEGQKLEVMHKNVVVHEYYAGESFGESSLLFKRPRSSTVVCASENCKLHEMLGSDFLSVVESSPETAAALRDMCRKRLFKKAVKNYSMGMMGRGLTNEDIVAAFHEADKNKDGRLSHDEIRDFMHHTDPTIPDQEIKALVKFIDVDEDGYCGLDEFKRLFRQFEHDD